MQIPEKIQEKYKPIAIAKAEVKPIAIDDREIDSVLADYAHLRDLQWTAYHAKRIKTKGTQWYIEKCKIAIADGNKKKKYLSWLISRDI